MKMKKIFLFLWIAGMASVPVWGQYNVALVGASPIFPSLDQDIGQPFPRLISIGLPRAYVGETTNFPSLDTLLSYSSPQVMENAFPSRFYGHFSMNLGHLSLGARIFQRHHIRLASEWKSEGFIAVPRDLPDLLMNGNAHRIGDTIDLGVRFRFQTYGRYTLNYIWAAPSYSIGAALHYYRGGMAVDMVPQQAGLYTHDSTLHLTVISDAMALATVDTAMARAIIEGGMDSLSSRARRLVPVGSGLGFSVGGRVRLLDFLNLSGSWANVGTIKWRQGVGYKFQSNYTFKGINIVDLLRDDSAAIAAAIDSAKANLQPTYVSTSFKTPTVQRFFLRGDIAIKNFSFLPVGVVLAGEKTDRWRLTYGAYFTMAFLPPLSLTLSASYRPLGESAGDYKTATPHIQWGGMLHGHIAKVVSYYIGTDNIPWRGLWRGDWGHWRHLDLTAGLSLHLGPRSPYHELSASLFGGQPMMPPQ